MNGGSFESQCTQIGENMWSKDAILTSVISQSETSVGYKTFKLYKENANTGR